MVNIPSNLQTLWSKVSENKNITKDEYQALLKEAAPSLKDASDVSIDKVKEGELDPAEKAFFEGLASVAKTGNSVKVQEGKAPGTFEFVEEKPESAKTNFTDKYHVSLDGEPKKDEKVTGTPASGEVKKDEKATVTPASGEVKKDEKATGTPASGEVKKDEKATGTTPSGTEKYHVSLDGEPKKDEKVTGTPASGEVKKDEKATGTASEPPKANEKLQAELDKIEQKIPTLKTPEDKIKVYEELKAKLPEILGDKKEDIAKFSELIDKKIEKIKNPTAEVKVDKPTEVSTEAPKVDTKKLEGYNQLKEQATAQIAKLKGEIEAAKDNKPLVEEKSKELKTWESTLDELVKVKIPTEEKKVAFSEINSVIDKATKDALTTGKLEPFTVARQEVEKIVAKYKGLEGDGDIKKIKSILAGDKESENIKLSSGNQVMKAINTIDNTNKIIDKPTITREDYNKGKELIKELPKGEFQEKLQAKLTSYENRKAGEAVKNKETLKSGLEDTIGNGFFNAANKEGTRALFQTMAKDDDFEARLKRLKPDDQVKAMKILAEGDDPFSLAIARNMFYNSRSHSDIDAEFSKKELEKISGKTNKKDIESEVAKLDKEKVKPDFSKFEVNKNDFAAGLKYSLYSEKEAAVSMVRAINDGKVSPSVLSKFDEYEINDMVKLLDKKGTKEEKEDFMSLISSAYNSGENININYLNKDTKAQIMSSVLSTEPVNEKKLAEIIETGGKSTVFELVNKGSLNDKQLSILAKNTNGDTMSDDIKVSSKMLGAMIKTYNQDPKNTTVSLKDINKFIDEIGKDRDRDEVMKRLIDELGDGPSSQYQKFKELAPATLDKMWNMSK